MPMIFMSLFRLQASTFRLIPDSYRQQKARTVPGLIGRHSARIKPPHLLRAIENGFTPAPLNPATECVYGVKNGSKHAKQHDDEERNKRDAFVREHGGLLLYSLCRNLEGRHLRLWLDECMFIFPGLNCASSAVTQQRFDNCGTSNCGCSVAKQSNSYTVSTGANY